MNLIELIKGTPEEVAAKQNIRKLDERANKGKTLSQLQEVAYANSKQVAHRLSRRRFLVASGGLVVIAAAGGLGTLFRDSDEADEVTSQRNTVENTPINTSEPAISESLESWSSLPAEERLKKLFTYAQPDVENFDLLAETVLAAAQYYQQQSPSKFTVDDYIAKTHLIEDVDEFLDLIIQSGNISYAPTGATEQQIRDLIRAKNVSAYTSVEGDNEVYLSVGILREKLANATANSSNTLEISKKFNILAQFVTYNLLHEYGHMNESMEVVRFEKPVDFSVYDARITVSGLEGTNVDMVIEQGEIRISEVINSDEALIDTRAHELFRKIDPDFLAWGGNSFDFGRAYVTLLNKGAGIDSQQLAMYISGDLPIKDLLTKWGGVKELGGYPISSTDTPYRRGLKILTVIGLQSSGRMDNYTSTDFILDLPTPEMQTVPLGIATVGP